MISGWGLTTFFESLLTFIESIIQENAPSRITINICDAWAR